MRGLAFVAGVVALATGCGGALPLLHGAHVENEGSVTAGAGVAAQIAAGNAATSIQNARESAGATTAPLSDSSARYREGALAVAALAPGLSPVVAARVGIGWSSEAGLAYTGRALRVDARRSFEDGKLALSIGGGANAVLARRGSGASEDLAGLDLEGVSGYGFDVPVLVGYRSDAGLVSAYAGARAGFERLGGNIGLGGAAAPAPTPEADPKVSFSANRFYGGGLLGLRLGFRHLFAVVEMQALYHSASGTLGGENASVTGFSLAPAGALLGRF